MSRKPSRECHLFNKYVVFYLYTENVYLTFHLWCNMIAAKGLVAAHLAAKGLVAAHLAAKGLSHFLRA